MGFILGVLIGLLSAIVGCGALVYFFCIRSNNLALARLLNGVAQALATKRRSSEPSEPSEPSVNGDSTQEAGKTPKKRW